MENTSNTNLQKPTAARGHMPFRGHRTCAEWGENKISSASRFVPRNERNRKLWRKAARDNLVGRWRDR